MNRSLVRVLPSRLWSFVGLIATLVTATRAQNAGGDPINPPAPEASITWLEPAAGAKFAAGERITLRVEAVDPAGAITDVDFLADGRVIGRSQIRFIVPPAPGAPLQHTLLWSGATAGSHVLVAQSIRADGRVVKSPPREIWVGTGPAGVPVVTLTAIDAEAQEADPRDILVFELKRSGDPAKELTVELETGGTATRGTDYDLISRDGFEWCPDCLRPVPPPLERTVTFPAGGASVRFGARALPDKALEGEESVVVRVLPPVMITLEGVVPPYAVGTPSEAIGWIREQPVPGELPLVTVKALDGEMREGREDDVVKFEVRRTGPTTEPLTVWFGLEGTATPRVDYARVPADPLPVPDAGGNLPAPGTPPQYTVEIPAGSASAVLTYRALADAVREVNETLVVVLQQPIPPPNVRLRKTYEVGDPGTARGWIVDASLVAEPSLVLVRPVAGASYTAPAEIRLEAVVRDPAGVVGRVAFFDGEKQVGASELALSPSTPPGTPLTHVFTWRGAPAGEHSVSARARTAAGRELRSVPVMIRVVAGSEPAVVTVEATRAMTPEPSPTALVLPGVFTLRRTGPTVDPLRVLYSISGTARNGVDYAPLDGDATIAAGSATREIRVEARMDSVVEGPETVILTLRPDSAYRVGELAAATVTIADASPVPAARMILTSPVSGQRFNAPADVPLKATAVDPAGWIGRVEFLANDSPVAVSELVFIRAPDPGTVLVHEATWAGAKPGNYRLTARARTSAGEEVISPPVEIVVAEPPPQPWVVRELPDSYAPGAELEVRLVLAPPPGVAAVAVEDQPPKGWTVGLISDGGAFDPSTGRVKFGPFLENPARAVTYRVTSPAGMTGRAEFAGLASADGGEAPVGGDQAIVPQVYHPADKSPADSSLGMSEVTAYAGAWREGREWTPGPNPIPLSYVTRAAFLWKSGEAYRHDPSAGPLPLAWVIAPRATPAGELVEPTAEAPADGVVEAAAIWMRPPPGVVLAEMAAPDPATGRSWVTVRALPGPGVRAYGIEMRIPEGVAADGVSEAGLLDPSGRVIRWGPFLDAEPRRFEFQVTGPIRPGLSGRFSADGRELPVVLVAAPPADLVRPRIAHVETADSGLVQLVVEDPAAGDCEVEMSTDLRTWRVVGRTPAGQEASLHADTDAGEQPVRFYRVRRRD